MIWPLDASRSPRTGSPVPSEAASWWDPWLEATRWWTTALSAGARLGSGADAKLLAELAGGVARAFRGRRVGVEVCGRRVRAEIGSVSLKPAAGRYTGQLELRSVDCGGVVVEELSVIAADVALATGRAVALVASGVQFHGRSPLEPIVAWLDATLPDWSVSVAEDHLIEAVRRRGGRRYLVRAAIHDDVAELELRAVRVRGLTVPCPPWPRLTRRLPLPPLPGGLSVAEAVQHEAAVEFRCSMPTLTHAFDPRRVRRGILSLRPAASGPPLSGVRAGSD